MYYSADQLITMMSRAKDFIKVPDDYHIIGVRANEEDRKLNKFSCTFHLMHGSKLVLSTSGTTVCGKPALKGGFKRFNSKGVAVLMANRVYNGVWIFGKHRGWMEALRQLGSSVWVFRDGDLDDLAEETGKPEKGFFGINFHTASKNYFKNLVVKFINGWSYGCQVANRTRDYRRILKLCKPQKRVTYTLLDEFSI